jgi:putative FmdB family regulatory protein
MPSFVFQCNKCNAVYEQLTAFDKTEKYPKVKCSGCGSKKKTKLITAPAGVIFTNARESSKWDNFGYRAGKTMEEAKDCRRNAQEKSHMGADPYVDAAAQVEADLNNDANWGEVK